MAGRLIRLGDAVGPGTIQAAAVTGGKWLELHDLQGMDHSVVSREVAIRFGFRAALCCPLKIGDQLVGYLNHFIGEDRPFSDLERNLIEILAHRATAALEASNCGRALRRYEQLSAILQQVDEARTIEQVLEVVLDGALELTGTTHGWVSRLDPATRKLRIDTSRGEPATRSLDYGQGLTGMALREQHVVRVDDVQAQKWLRGLRAILARHTLLSLLCRSALMARRCARGAR